MQTTSWNGISLSQMMLGTVQFGMPYGVANQIGQPGYRDVVAIIDAAVGGGVNCFDTAAAYGNSEEILGLAIDELRISNLITVVTKVRALTDNELQSPQLAATAIRTSVEHSLQRLRMDCLPIVLFHREADARYLDVLEQLREEGKLKHFGVSCSNAPGAAIDFVNKGQASAIQIPINVADHRHVRSGVLTSASSTNAAIFARSVYLQGLLAMQPRDIPEKLRGILSERQRLSHIADASGIALPELALRYVLSLHGVTSVLTGVETREQVEQNLRMFSKGPLPSDVLTEIRSNAVDLPEFIVTPSMWSI